ncbi:hypothetical protein PG993_000487 [Apiospora rasikravindrae]|uniref:Rhodopsin domain-containing protein n=1 Tax=Apiospora rasikravindrae TaxID=990691 RepID=A0ABR1U8P6_9PEZI
MAPRTLGFDVNPAGTRLFVVQMVALVLASLACYLRVYVRAFMVRKVLVEDWMMLAAVLIYTPTSIIILHSIALGGTGLHTTQLTQEGIIVALRAWYLGEVLYVPTATLIRMSIAFFLLRIAVKPWHVWITRINVGVILVINIVYFFNGARTLLIRYIIAKVMVIQCTPPSFFWEGPAKVPGAHGSCINKAIVPISTILHSVLSALSDWTLALLPIAMLWNVQINLRTKISVAVLLSTGLVAGIALILRASNVRDIAISADFLHDTVDVATWSVLEPALGIIAGCIATLRPLFKNFGLSGLKRSMRYNSSNNKKQSHSGNSSTGAGGSGPSRRMTRPSNGVHYNNNRNMLRLDDMDDDEEDLVVIDDDRNKGELDLELAPTNKTKIGTTTTTTVAAAPESSTSNTTTTNSQPDTRGSEAKLNKLQRSPTFLSNRSSSSRIYDNMDTFGNSRDQHWEIESLRPPPQARRNREQDVEALATDGRINVQTTFDLHSLSSSSVPLNNSHQQQHSVTAFSAEPTGSNTSSSSRELPLQGTTTWSLTPPPTAKRHS